MDPSLYFKSPDASIFKLFFLNACQPAEHANRQKKKTALNKTDSHAALMHHLLPGSLATLTKRDFYVFPPSRGSQGTGDAIEGIHTLCIYYQSSYGDFFFIYCL